MSRSRASVVALLAVAPAFLVVTPPPGASAAPAPAGAQVQVAERLGTDLQANAFQAWLLRDAFERIVAGASQRLMELSGRYTLQWHDDEFAVVDHDHAQERRAADTLSGGETFLASLALALELSEQVQRAAPARLRHHAAKGAGENRPFRFGGRRAGLGDQGVPGSRGAPRRRVLIAIRACAPRKAA